MKFTIRDIMLVTLVVAIHASFWHYDWMFGVAVTGLYLVTASYWISFESPFTFIRSVISAAWGMIILSPLWLGVWFLFFR